MTWTPTGPLVVVLIPGSVTKRAARGAAEDRIEDWGDGGLTARLFVGLSVGDRPVYTIKHVVAVTRDFRMKRGQSPDASFIAQHGIYKPEGAPPVTENSVQIVIFAKPGMPMEEFKTQMEGLATHLRRKLDQDQVIVELQDHGVAKSVFAVQR